jgi:hypothetical protein
LTERIQLGLLRLGGFAVAIAALVLTARYGGGQPLLFGTLSSLIAWYVGKATGEPIAAVTIQALQSMRPGVALDAVAKIAAEHPQPERAGEVAEAVIRALHSMAPPPPIAAPVQIIDDEPRQP